MSLKKNFRADGTYIISTDAGDNPKLGAKVLRDGRESLFLDFYFGYTKELNGETGKEVTRADRRRESLRLYLWQAPRTAQERQQNKDTLELAKRIRFERGQQLLENLEGYRLKKSREINFLNYFKDYIQRYTKKDKRMVQMAYNRFEDFLRDTPDYSKYKEYIKPDQITRDMITAFTEYLQTRGKGEGPSTLYRRFKKVIRNAVEHGVFLKNPSDGISIKVDEQRLTKEVLSIEETKQLAVTHYQGENENIRRAFLFCLSTGIRRCDLVDLTFENVDFSNRLLRFEQNKTKGHSATSGVVIPLNDGLLRLIGSPTSQNNRSERIFPLPSEQMCLKALRTWVRRAGINKHITWHCARHSFAVNILNNGANIKTVASLLGHSSLKHTEKYTRAVDSLKQDAVNSLPALDMDLMQEPEQ